MPTAVFFATNRAVTNATDPNDGYKPVMVPPLRPQDITYARARVDGVDINTNAQGFVAQIDDVTQGRFSDQAIATLSNPRTDLLVFIHGFDNTFSDAISRAGIAKLAGAGAGTMAGRG